MKMQLRTANRPSTRCLIIIGPNFEILAIMYCNSSVILVPSLQASFKLQTLNLKFRGSGRSKSFLGVKRKSYICITPFDIVYIHWDWRTSTPLSRLRHNSLNSVTREVLLMITNNKFGCDQNSNPRGYATDWPIGRWHNTLLF